MEIENSDKLVEAFEGLSKRQAREGIDKWFEASQDRIANANSQRSGIDSKRDSRGSLKGRQDNDLHRIAQSAQPPEWTGDAWEFTYTHFASKFMNYGVKPHPIEATGNGFLAFEWPDAPDDVVAMFSPGGEDEVNRSEWDGMVYFKSIQHPGVPAIGFMQHGRNKARQLLNDRSTLK